MLFVAHMRLLIAMQICSSRSDHFNSHEPVLLQCLVSNTVELPLNLMKWKKFLQYTQTSYDNIIIYYK